MRTTTPSRHEPGEDETIIDDPDRRTSPSARRIAERKIYVDGVGVTIVAERVEYLDEYGKLVTESLRDYTKNALRNHFASLDEFLKRWNAAERKQAIIEELAKKGLALDHHRPREVGKEPRSLRPDLPHRLRRQATDPSGARRKRQ